MMHQFKDFVGANTSCQLEWEGQSTLAPSASTVYLQIFNKDTPAWETIDSDNTTGANTDFTLTANIANTADYKGGTNIIVCRVFQLAL